MMNYIPGNYDFISVCYNNLTRDYEYVSNIRYEWSNEKQTNIILFDCVTDGIRFHIETIGVICVFVKRCEEQNMNKTNNVASRDGSKALPAEQ